MPTEGVMLMAIIATSRGGTALERPAGARWATPAIKRLVAGAAEDGAGGSPDSGLNPS